MTFGYVVTAVAWKINYLANLHWRHFDDECVVFDSGSGQTHQLSRLHAVTLMLIEGGPISSGELTDLVAAETEIDLGLELSIAISCVLDSLNHIGLVETTSQ